MNKPYNFAFSALLLSFIMQAQEDGVNKSEKTIDLAFYAESKSSYATMEPGVVRKKMVHEFRVHASEISKPTFADFLKTIATHVAVFSDTDYAEPLVAIKKQKDLISPDIQGVAFGDGMVRAAYWQMPRLLVVEIEAPKSYCSFHLGEQILRWFGLIEYSEHELSIVDAKEQNPKVEVREDLELGKGIFAKEDINKGEFIGGLYGQFFQAESSMDLPDEWRDHVMQCAPHLWRACRTKDEAMQYLNHSCEPNVGVLGFFDFVAMRDIKSGEELTNDYAMQDDSNWQVPGGKCLCNSQQCRGIIPPYHDLSAEEQKKIDSYVSQWILHKYNKCGCSSN